MNLPFELQLSHSDNDPEGWTEGEVKGYDGWGHDSQRDWRKGDRLRDRYSVFGTVRMVVGFQHTMKEFHAGDRGCGKF